MSTALANSGQPGQPGNDPTAAAPGGSPGQPVGADANQPSAYRPDGLPDHLAGTDDKSTIDNLYKAFSGYRERAGQLEAPPKDPTGYEFKWGDKTAPYLKDIGDDKLLTGMRDVALKSGLNNQQFAGFLDGAFELMLEMDLIDKPVDTAAELAKMLPADAVNLTKPEQDAAIQKRMSANVAYVDGLVEMGLTKEAAAALKAELVGFPELHQLLELQRNGGGARPALGGNPAPAITAKDLAARQADPRNQFGNAKFDGAFAAETTRLYQQLFPEPAER